MVTKDFNLPIAPKKNMWSLSEKECLFLDLTIFFSTPIFELYKMVVGKDLTDAQCRVRASAILTSLDGKDYLSSRRLQLQSHFYPDLAGTEIKKGADGFSQGFNERVIEEIEKAVNNPSSTVHFDAIKLAFSKIQKEIEQSEIVEPPKRYLPISCRDCAYKEWIETNCEVLCFKCRYRKYATDHGITYKFTEMIDHSLKNGSEDDDEVMQVNPRKK